MSQRKLVLLSTLYLGLAAGVPIFLILLISQSYPVFNNVTPPNAWQLRSQLLVIQPEGQMLLPAASAFIVHKGQITLLTYPRIDQNTLQTQKLGEGKSFGTWSGRRYSIVNRETTPVALIMTQVSPPGVLALPTSTPSSTYDKGYTLEILSQSYITAQPASDELEQLAFLQRESLLKKEGPAN